jgi:spoIIIJ-associated protein
MLTSQPMIEARGDNVEEAIESGLSQLGVKREAVNVEVIEEGSRGFLGLGSRPAVVRLTVKEQPATPAARPRSEPTAAAKPPAAAPVTGGVQTTWPPPPATEAVVETVEKVETAAPTAIVSEEERQAELATAVDVVQTLLARLHVQANVSGRLLEPDDVTGEQLPVIDIRGRDLGVLIGPQAETLNSLQYIARLMVGHRLQRRANFIMDVEAYRERRHQALARMAERMADKVIRGGRAISLEPMPANERRVIHVTLRDHNQVYTQSIGEGRRRQVRIHPKRDI